jgi:hypothetical protein
MGKKKCETVLPAPPSKPGKPSAVVDTRVVYCGDNLEQLKKLPVKAMLNHPSPRGLICH